MSSPKIPGSAPDLAPNPHARSDGSHEPPGQPGDPPTVLHVLRLNGATYQLRLINCGKANCRRCNKDGHSIPSHGPYWYLSWTHEGKTRRKYLGKDLDTRLYRSPDGHLDLDALLGRPSRHDPPPVLTTAALERRARLEALEDSQPPAKPTFTERVKGWCVGSKVPLRTRQESYADRSAAFIDPERT